MATPPPEPGRRLGERIPIGDVLLVWRARHPDEKPSRKGGDETQVGRLLNISVSGAAIVAPAAADLHPGCVILIQMGNAQAAVRIRRVEDFGEPAWRIFGVEFVETEPEFLDWINHLLDVRRDADLMEVWNRAH